MDDKNFHVDYDAFIQQAVENIQNQALNSILALLFPKDNESVYNDFFKLIRAANKHGVSTQTMLDIFQEMGMENKKNQ